LRNSTKILIFWITISILFMSPVLYFHIDHYFLKSDLKAAAKEYLEQCNLNVEPLKVNLDYYEIPFRTYRAWDVTTLDPEIHLQGLYDKEITFSTNCEGSQLLNNKREPISKILDRVQQKFINKDDYYRKYDLEKDYGPYHPPSLMFHIFLMLAAIITLLVGIITFIIQKIQLKN
jgi:hypothetical protein